MLSLIVSLTHSLTHTAASTLCSILSLVPRSFSFILCLTMENQLSCLSVMEIALQKFLPCRLCISFSL